MGLFTDRNPEMERTKAAHMNGKREYLMGYSCEGSRQHQGPFHGFKHSTERERASSKLFLKVTTILQSIYLFLSAGAEAL